MTIREGEITPHQAKLLAEALGNVLVKAGVIRVDAVLSGPELLLAAETYCVSRD